MEIQLLGRKGAPTSQSEWKEELIFTPQLYLIKVVVMAPQHLGLPRTRYNFQPV
jgi:hypothetical protein